VQRLVSICFDDALARQKDLVKELGICATFSIPTELVGVSPRYLSWDDIRELQADGHEIACHSHRHNEWSKEGYDVEEDIRTSVGLLRENGIDVRSLVPPRNKWIESPIIRETFSTGRKGDGQLIADRMRIKACGLTQLKRDNIDYALNFNKPRNWVVYVAHLYKDDGVPDERFGDEWFVIRTLVEQLKKEGCRFVSLNEIGEEFQEELNAILEVCPICGVTELTDFNGRLKVKCVGCDSLERHRDLAFLIEKNLIQVNGKICLLVSSGEMLKCLKRNGASVTVISQFQENPYNDVRDLSVIAEQSVDLIILQHVLPHVEEHCQALQEMRRVLKPDGAIYAQHPVRNVATHPPYSPSRNVFSERQWLSEVTQSGFVVERFPMIPMDDMFVLRRS